MPAITVRHLQAYALPDGVLPHPVLTWAGNNVCTAQFIKPADEEKTRGILEDYFDRFGGCREMTTEPVAAMWRARRNGKLATVLPLVQALD